MNKKIEILIDKLYRYDRKDELCFIGFPLPKGTTTDTSDIQLWSEDETFCLPTQMKVTSRYDDNSIRFVFIRFLADIPANKRSRFFCVIGDGNSERDSEPAAFKPISLEKFKSGYRIETVDEEGKLFSYEVRDNSSEIFSSLSYDIKCYKAKQFMGPCLNIRDAEYTVNTGTWEVVEQGPLCVVLRNKGFNLNEKNGEKISFELKLTAYAGKAYTEVSYRLINDTDELFEIKRLDFRVFNEESRGTMASLVSEENKSLDSTGCGDHLTKSEAGDGPIYHVSNTAECDALIDGKELGKVRAITASSNYKTDYYIGKDGAAVSKIVDHKYLLKEGNEHFSEVFYGTFFADCTDDEGGVCGTIFQAQQNYPKAVLADKEGITLFLVPECEDKVVLQSGMSREQKFLLHFHAADMSMTEINDRSIVYQMPYRPYVSPSVFREAGVFPDIFVDEVNFTVEQNLVARADGHCRALGMLNFGDSYDANYTAQGRGGGKLVWCNNEYDYPHACALMYARTGIRRFMDYTIASASHWMDVDVCHYHKNPLYIGGQWEHTAGHVINGVMVCSHEWVEGLLDYYHFTGDERGLETAIGIGENVLRLLDMPMYAKPGEANARETGWALRSLTALYVETLDKKWLSKCDKILNDFKLWEQQYGHWLAPYTDNTIIRVGFMISVAVGSLMRYYNQFPDEELKGLILRAVDDVIENCYVKEWGIFYYKELPSLNRLGTNTLLLEALTAAYDLSGDKKYLEYGIGTFKRAMSDSPSYSSTKRHEDDAVLVGNMSSKNFAQSMIPIAGFYRAITNAGVEVRSIAV
nr:hypothetical protein [uncultured Butyrivibrio sp.]